MKKYVAEFIGTAVLTGVGCGTAMTVGCDAANGSGYLITAIAFGLSIVAMAYSIGNISGCHINPAVTLAVWMRGRMESSDVAGYIVAQILGAFAGSAIDLLIFTSAGITDATGGLGANGLAGVNGSMPAGFIVEVFLTFIFILCILGVTDSKFNHGSFGGLVIGLALIFVHLMGIGLTGTSVNPARSIAPAVFAAVMGNTAPIAALWVFIAAPLCGGALAALVYGLISTDK